MNSAQSMIQNVSDTAIWVAYYRALETKRSDAVFMDPLAEKLIGHRGEQIANEFAFKNIMAWVMTIRTHSIDQLILQAIDEGADTVLNLGAGLDTRPYRMNLPSHIKWVEIDQASIIDLKEQRLKDIPPSCQLERVSLDLSDLSAQTQILAQIASQSKSVVVLTEGVIPYLSPLEAKLLSSNLLDHKEFQFWIQDYFRLGAKNPIASLWSHKLKAAPFLFKTRNWIGFFENLGWRVQNNLSILDQAQLVNRPFPGPMSFNPRKAIRFLPGPLEKRVNELAGYVLFSPV